MSHLSSDGDPNPLESSSSLQVNDDGSIYEDVYSEIGTHDDTEQLIKPNRANIKRNGFAGGEFDFLEFSPAGMIVRARFAEIL